MQLTKNRYFKHKYFKNSIIKTEVRVDKNMEGMASIENLQHLYITLVNGESIIGWKYANTFMLATALHQENWTTLLEKWIKNNQYEDYNPFLMTQEESEDFLKHCYELKNKHNIRLGQVIINELEETTPTPNIDIFNSTNEEYVLAWFYKNCVK